MANNYKSMKNMKSKLLYIITMFFVILIMSSCTTYYVSINSLKKQFAEIDVSKRKEVTLLQGGMFIIGKYSANTITFIKCTDKNGYQKELKNSPSIETRITYGSNNKRVIVYFDTIALDSINLYGCKSRFIPILNVIIPLDSITKIEIQDGHKNFSYLN